MARGHVIGVAVQRFATKACRTWRNPNGGATAFRANSRRKLDQNMPDGPGSCAKLALSYLQRRGCLPGARGGGAAAYGGRLQPGASAKYEHQDQNIGVWKGCALGGSRSGGMAQAKRASLRARPMPSTAT